MAAVSGTPPRILFVTSNRIGDAVLSSGLLAHLIERLPGARITLACGPVAAPLFAEVPGLERLIVMTKRDYSLHWLSLWARTVTRLWDLVVDLRASALAWIVPARHRLIFKPSRDRIHRVVQLAALVGRADAPPAPRLWLGEKQRAEATRLIPEGGPVLAIGPTANWGAKQWPIERFIETVHRLMAEDGILSGARVAVLGAPSERPAAQPLLDALDGQGRIDLIGAADLLTIHACLERCALYVGNDSGLMHMAAAAGVPTLGLFGPSPEDHYGPWGPNARSVRGDRSFWDIVLDPSYDHRKQDSLMDDLTVERVVAAAADLYKSVAGRP